MKKARASQHLLARVAIFAILMASLAPTISRALAACAARASLQVAWAPLCSADRLSGAGSGHDHVHAVYAGHAGQAGPAASDDHDAAGHASHASATALSPQPGQYASLQASSPSAPHEYRHRLEHENEHQPQHQHQPQHEHQHEHQHQHDSLSLEHCGYCYFDHHAPALPGLPASLPLVLTADSMVPTLFLQAPRLQAIWRSAQPRGPPVMQPA